MKKILLISIIAFIALTAFAQTTTDNKFGNWSTEVQFNPFGNNFETFRMADLKFRYFYNEGSALRFTVGVGMDNSKNKYTDEDDDPAEDTENYQKSYSKTVQKSSAERVKLAIGYEKHFNIYDKIDVFVGGEVGYEAIFYSGSKITDSNQNSKSVDENYYWNYTRYNYTVTTTSSSATHSITKYHNENTDGKCNQHSFFVNAFVGMDFYVYKGIYIGTELGLGFKNTSIKNGYYTTESETNSTYNRTYSGEALQYMTYQNENETKHNTSSYSSKTGISTSSYNTTCSISSHNQNDTSTSYYGISDNSSITNTLGLYIEPSLRLGIRF